MDTNRVFSEQDLARISKREHVGSAPDTVDVVYVSVCPELDGYTAIVSFYYHQSIVFVCGLERMATGTSCPSELCHAHVRGLRAHPQFQNATITLIIDNMLGDYAHRIDCKMAGTPNVTSLFNNYPHGGMQTYAGLMARYVHCMHTALDGGYLAYNANVVSTTPYNGIDHQRARVVALKAEFEKQLDDLTCVNVWRSDSLTTSYLCGDLGMASLLGIYSARIYACKLDNIFAHDC